jgi:hypothetical protein
VLAGLFLRPTFAHGAAASPTNGKGWSVVKGPNLNLNSNGDGLSGVAAISANDVWAVGFYSGWDGLKDHALIGHWDGTAWSVVPHAIPGDISLSGVAAVATNDVWAFGEDLYGGTGHVLTAHWDGSTWSIIANSAPTNSVLTAITAVSSTDIWAVGSTVFTESAVIMHWNGTAWSLVPAPSGYLDAVTAVSATDVWAVGRTNDGTVDLAFIEHWDGKNWKVVASPAIAGSEFSGVAAVSATDVWAVGFISTGKQQGPTLTEHWNGTQWTVVPSPSPRLLSQLTAVSAVSANNVWAVGYSYDIASNRSFTLIVHWNGTAWSVVSSPNPGLLDNLLVGVTRVPGTTQLWAVGNYLQSNTASSKTLTEFHP